MSRISLAAVVIAAQFMLTPAADAVTIELNDRIATISGGVNAASIGKVVKKVLEYESQSYDPIWLLIDSFGGSVDAGFILIDLMKSIKSPVYVIVTSKAYSMGAIITVYAEKRYIYRHGTMMLHEASYGALGEDPSIRSRIGFNTKYLDRLHEEIAKIIKMDVKEYRARIRDAWWVMAEDAVKYGWVDGIVTDVVYKKAAVETIEIKRTRKVKREKMVRPDAASPPSS